MLGISARGNCTIVFNDLSIKSDYLPQTWDFFVSDLKGNTKILADDFSSAKLFQKEIQSLQIRIKVDNIQSWCPCLSNIFLDWFIWIRLLNISKNDESFESVHVFQFLRDLFGWILVFAKNVLANAWYKNTESDNILLLFGSYFLFHNSPEPINQT